MTCHWVSGSRHLHDRGAFIFKLKHSCSLKMKEPLSFDTLGTAHSVTQHCILEDKVLNIILSNPDFTYPQFVFSTVCALFVWSWTNGCKSNFCRIVQFPSICAFFGYSPQKCKIRVLLHLLLFVYLFVCLFACLFFKDFVPSRYCIHCICSICTHKV